MKRLVLIVLTVTMLITMSVATVFADTHDVGFQKILNAHDLGGYKTTDGRTVRKGVLLRSGELSYATPEDIRKLKETYNIKAVFDFRYPTDHKYCPDKGIPGAKNMNVPTKYKKAPKAKTPKKRYKKFKKYGAGNLSKKMIPTFKKMDRDYTYDLIMSSYSRNQYRKFFNYLLANDPQNGVLFHCIHGKDRTGVVSFMLLVALGTSEETAYSDYALTNKWLDEHGHKKYKKGKVGVRVNDLRYTISKVKREYGSMENFLNKAYGLDKKDIRTLREKYTY